MGTAGLLKPTSSNSKYILATWNHLRQCFPSSIPPSYGKNIQATPNVHFLVKAGRSPWGVWRALAGYYSRVVESKPAERHGCLFLLGLGGASPGVQRGRATDRAVTLWGRMKRGNCPNKVNVICSLSNLMTFWAADLIRHNLRRTAWEATQKDANPFSSPSQAHQPLLRISLHHTKPSLRQGFALLLQINKRLHTNGVTQPGPEIQAMPPPLSTPASCSTWTQGGEFPLQSAYSTYIEVWEHTRFWA